MAQKTATVSKHYRMHVIEVSYRPKKDADLGMQIWTYANQAKFCKVRLFNQRSGVIRISGSAYVLNNVEKIVKAYFE